MIVVAYLYNRNGMASWCLDAAKALHLSGKDVIIVKSKNVQLPADYPVKHINFELAQVDYENRSILKKVADKFSQYYQLFPFAKNEDTFLPALHQHLKEQGIQPHYYLFNQTSFVTKSIAVPQFVVAWTYKPFLNDYLRKAMLLSEGIGSLKANLMNAFFWHKTDWAGYKNAQGVLSVSNALTGMLGSKDINAHTVYPGADSVATQAPVVSNKTLTFVVMALDLDHKRKGLEAIISKLKKLTPYNFKLILIGKCAESFKERVLSDNFPAVFTGLLNREEAVAKLNACDVLLFGSLVDDWGFVQVEAMSRGMAVLSPNASPFNEIIGRDDYLYNALDENDLEVKLKQIITKNADVIEQDKRWFKERYTAMFSLQKFGKSLIETITTK